MSQALSNREMQRGAIADTGRREAWRRRSRRRSGGSLRVAGDAPYEGDTHLLDGPAWWTVWVAGLLAVSVPGMVKLIPDRPWWEFIPAFALIGVGLGVVYYGWRVGNPIQRACCVVLTLVFVGLGAKLGDWAIGTHIHNGTLQHTKV
ncbi:MAG: hypothetical protein AAGF84_05010 [Planctomycetota bacterium]